MKYGILLCALILAGCSPSSSPSLSVVTDLTHESDLTAVFVDKRLLTQTTREFLEQAKLEAEATPGQFKELRVKLKDGFVYDYELETLDCHTIHETCVEIEQLAGLENQDELDANLTAKK